MLLSELLLGIEAKNSYEDVEILDVCSNTSEELKGGLFFCIKGENADGHRFVKKAFAKGAVAVVCQESPAECENENIVLVEDTREAYAVACKHFFQNASDTLKLIAVTGTNGKTSVATLVKRLLNEGGLPCGLISTIEAQYNDTALELSRTTPNPYTLHRLFYDMTKSGMKAVSLEASSHALDQKRLSGLEFAVAVFTNLTQDHLDYHKSMLEYYGAKKKLFKMAKNAVVNIDSSYGKELVESLSIPYVTCSVVDPSADFFGKDISCHKEGVSFTLLNEGIACPVKFAIPGIYSVQNALSAIAVCRIMKMPLCTIVDGIAKMEGIRGRSEIIKTNRGFNVICDYAHTPDGLENILKSTREYAKGRIILLFGCGGERDKTKRPIMGSIAASYADFTVITSDNPRNEMPNKIIGDIIKGVPEGTRFIAIADRREAIRYALDIAKPDDTVILAGKGHEQYQVLGDKKLAFDEHRLVGGILNSFSNY